MMKTILDQLARSTLLPDDLSKQILAGAEPPIKKLVMSLLISSLDCQATLFSDAEATMNEKRIARAVTTVAFLAALLSAKERE